MCHLEDRQGRTGVILVDAVKRFGNHSDLKECL